MWNRTLVSAFFLIMSGPVQAVVSTGIDEDAKLPYWEIRSPGISLRLVQRLPDQTRGYFMARGFRSEDAEIIARSCVFQTIFRNESHKTRPDALSYNLKEWTVLQAGHERKMKTREDWEPVWQAKGVDHAARIAFEWSLFPTRQVYRPGDYNWGMSIFDLRPGTVFDLRVSWRQYGKNHVATIPDIQCAPDIHPDTGAMQ
jgi:hypothetical protein